jgi:hypothetical protein
VTSNTTGDALPASVVEVVVESVGSTAVVPLASLLAADVGPVFGALDFAQAGTTTKTASMAADNDSSVEYLDDTRFPPFADVVGKGGRLATPAEAEPSTGGLN